VERAAFLEELEAVDLEWVAARFAQYRAEASGRKPSPVLSPAPVLGLPRTAEEREREAEARAVGEAALRAGRLAAFVVAGGQGTRLGFDGPKGLFPFGPVTGRTLFRIHAEQIRARARRYGAPIPWYIMTSPENNAATRSYFEARGFLGFDEKDVRFFAQATVPALDFEGRLLLAGKGRLARNPDGHGGSLEAPVRSGAIAEMRARGVDTISYFQVDNPLVAICDPVFAGHHIAAGADFSSKAVEKRGPGEKVGVFCLRDGRPAVVEYSDLDEAPKNERDASGRLRFWAGSIAVHLLSVDFVERMARVAELPWHVARKAVPALDRDGRLRAPDAPNSLKFERFVFDAMDFAGKSVAVEARREEEFAPLKNAAGDDSPETARRLASERAARLLEASGVRVPRGPDGRALSAIELSSLFALDAEELRARVDPALRVGTTLVLEEEAGGAP
ncbi:MAG: UDPGP type 1 family protein, partial [Planctomycetota bacterium]